MLGDLLGKFGDIGVTNGLTPKEATQRRLLVYQGGLMAGGGLLWGALCLAFGLWLPALIPFGYTAATLVNFTFLAFTKDFRSSRFVQVLISLLLPVGFQILLGGFHVSGAVALWSLLSLVSSITYQRIRSAVIWTLFYLILIVGLAAADPWLPRTLPAALAPVLFGVNVTVISACVVGLILYFVASRDQANEELELAQRETKRILDEVREGLLLLDREHNILPAHSRSALSLFGQESLFGRSFPALIGETTDVKSETLTDFLDLLFAGRLGPKKLNSLNPLSRVKALVPDGATHVTRHFSFRFLPITDETNRKILQVFVTIGDITEEVKLEEEIQQQQESTKKRIELLSELLYAKPVLIETFLNEAKQELRELDEHLTDNSNTKDFLGILNRIYRSVHAVKGNASLIRLDYFVSICHRLEDTISRLAKKDPLNGVDLIEVVGDLDNLKRSALDMEEQFQQLKRFGDAGQSSSEIDLLQTSLTDLAENVARREGKQVLLVADVNFDSGQTSLKFLRTVLVQLVRNAVVHGIEGPDERRRAGKPEQGTIHVSVSGKSDGMRITVRDDGRGVDLENIRGRAAVPGVNGGRLSDREALQLLFVSGFSTRDSVSEDGGRGVGLDLLREEVQRVGGVIKVRTRARKGSSFIVELAAIPAREPAGIY